MKKVLREMQTLRAGCIRRSQKKIRPAADPLPGGAGRPKFNQLDQFGEDRCTQFRVIAVTDPQTNTPTHKPTDRTDYNTLRRS